MSYLSQKFRPYYVLFLSILCAYMPHVLAQDLQNTLDEVLSARCLDEAQTGISIVALPSGKAIYSHHADTPLLPASTLKTVTTAAALRYLSPEYRFITQFLYSGTRQGAIIQGDLIVKAGGDPKLTLENLWQIAQHLRGMGIQQVTGKLLIDSQFFDNLTQAPEWGEDESSQWAYDARLSAFALNFNTLAVHVSPAQVAGTAAQVWLESQPPYLQLHNQTTTSTQSGNSVALSREQDEQNNVHLYVQGKVSLSAEEKVIYLNVDDPIRYAAESFRSVLKQAGIEVLGATVLGKMPEKTQLLHRHLSPPLSMILKELNTFSNNFIAEQVLKTIAAEVSKQPGSHVEGLRLVQAFLQALGVRLTGVNLVDGSGLSRKNHVTAQAMTDFFTAISNRFDIGPDFLTALRVMGAQGALSPRLSHSPARAQIRAKTGTLTGMSGLAGYVANTQGAVFAYAFLLNNNRCGYTGADVIEDKIVNAIHQLTVTTTAKP
jgi:D-alanyl-D-alanine carboxypeptidase/D-alanyl-D-alanine-endopeptidase (penicillin-binding protein 4)